VTLETLRDMITDLARSTAVGFEQVGLRFDRVEERLDRVEKRLDKVEARLDKVEQAVKEFRTDLRELRIEFLGTRRKVAEHDEEIDLLKARAGAAG
jgi:chromosome segregation ATPase